MAYFNLNADLYPITSATVDFNTRTQALPPVDEEASGHLMGDTWAGVTAPPSPTAGFTMNQIDFDPWFPASDATQPAGYGQTPYEYPGWRYRPEDPEPIGLSNWDGSLTARAAREPSPVPSPTSVPLICWGAPYIQSGPAFGAFSSQNVHAPHQPSIYPAWTELGQSGWLRPHGSYRARGVEHVNAVAGPSSPAPSRLPFVGPPTTQPPGGISEITADAENEQTSTEEHKTPKSKRTEVPSGRRKPPAKCRVQHMYYMRKLVQWVRKREGLKKPPSETEALAVVTKFIAESRQAAYQKPHLRTSKRLGENTEPFSKKAAKERERRDALRGSLEELSKYYLRDAGAKEWEVAELLSKVVEDVEAHPTPNESAPGASTSTAAASEVPANLPFSNSMALSPRRRSQRIKARPRR